jgi:hypothetical protein
MGCTKITSVIERNTVAYSVPVMNNVHILHTVFTQTKQWCYIDHTRWRSTNIIVIYFLVFELVKIRRERAYHICISCSVAYTRKHMMIILYFGRRWRWACALHMCFNCADFHCKNSYGYNLYYKKTRWL